MSREITYLVQARAGTRLHIPRNTGQYTYCDVYMVCMQAVRRLTLFLPPIGYDDDDQEGDVQGLQVSVRGPQAPAGGRGVNERTRIDVFIVGAISLDGSDFKEIRQAVQARLTVEPRTISSHLAHLVSIGQVRRTGSRGHHVYHLVVPSRP